jgi:hypothetical protein
MALIYAGGSGSADYVDGYTSAGWAPDANAYGGPVVLSGAGTVTQFGVWGGADTVARDLKVGIYTAGGTLVGSSTISMGTTYAWHVSPTVSISIASGATYIVLVSSPTTDVGYGFDTANDGSFATAAHAGFPQSSLTISTDTDRVFGVRVDFEASAAGNSQGATRRLMLGVG